MSEKVKVLYFIDRMLRGGIQTFVHPGRHRPEGSPDPPRAEVRLCG